MLTSDHVRHPMSTLQWQSSDEQPAFSLNRSPLNYAGLQTKCRPPPEDLQGNRSENPEVRGKKLRGLQRKKTGLSIAEEQRDSIRDVCDP
jgi:hypothetical protein